jgi:hypothetical protein
MERSDREIFPNSKTSPFGRSDKIYFSDDSNSNDEFQIWAMNNRKEIRFLNKKLFIAPPEYVIIKKIEFYNEGKSQKHLYDISAMIKNSGNIIDIDFILSKLNDSRLLKIWEEIKLIS